MGLRIRRKTSVKVRLLTTVTAITAFVIHSFVPINVPEVVAASANVNNIVFAPASTAIDQGVIKTYQIKFRNGTKDESIDSSAQLTLSTSSPSGEFADGTTSTVWQKNATLATSASATKTFRYRDNTAGSSTLTAKVSGGGLSKELTATAQITVNDVISPNTPQANVSSGVYENEQLISLSSTDDSGQLPVIYYTDDGADPSVNSARYTTPISVASSKTIKAIAYDSSGNKSGVSSNIYVITPKIAILTPAAPQNLLPNDNSYTNNPNFDDSWTVVDGAISYEYHATYDGKSYSDSGVYERDSDRIIRGNTNAPDATYEWQVRAIGLGGAGPWSEKRTVTVDTKAPEVSIVNPDENSVVGGKVKIDVTLDDTNLAAYNLRIDNGGLVYENAASNGAQKTYELDASKYTSGKHTILATATDKAGNKTTVTRTVTIDSAGPSLTVTNPVDDQTLSGSFAVTSDISDDNGLGAYYVAVDGEGQYYQYTPDNGTQTSPVDSTKLSNGTHTLLVRATDKFGNATEVKRTITIANQTSDTGSNSDDNQDTTGSGSNSGSPSQPDEANGTGEFTGNSGQEFSDGGVPLTDANSIDPLAPIASIGNSLSANSRISSTDQNIATGRSTTEERVNPSGSQATTKNASNSEKSTDTSGDVLGTSTSNPLEKTAALEPSSSGWKIFGVSWYWWLAGAAVLLTGWYFLAGVIRARRNSL